MMEKIRRNTALKTAVILAAALCILSGCGLLEGKFKETKESVAPEALGEGAAAGGDTPLVEISSGNAAVFAEGKEACRIMKALSGGGASAGYSSPDMAVSRFIRSDVLPEEGYAVISDENSPEQIYAWYEESEKAVCWYTKSPVAALNEDSSYMFYNMRALTDISGLLKIQSGSCTDFSHMFEGCGRLCSLSALSAWDMGRAEDLEAMFSSCRALKNVQDISGWDTGNVQDFTLMFNECGELYNIDPLSAWDTGNAKNMARMFSYCPSLNGADLSGWDTSSLENACGMFAYCENLGELNLSGWDMKNLSDSSRMFQGCGGLAAIYVNKETGDWASSCILLKDSSYMFPDCPMTATLPEDLPDSIRYGMAMARPFDGNSGCFTLAA